MEFVHVIFTTLSLWLFLPGGTFSQAISSDTSNDVESTTTEFLVSATHQISYLDTASQAFSEISTEISSTPVVNTTMTVSSTPTIGTEGSGSGDTPVVPFASGDTNSSSTSDLFKNVTSAGTVMDSGGSTSSIVGITVGVFMLAFLVVLLVVIGLLVYYFYTRICRKPNTVDISSGESLTTGEKDSEEMEMTPNDCYGNKEDVINALNIDCDINSENPQYDGATYEEIDDYMTAL